EWREIAEGRLGLGERVGVGVHGKMPCLVPLPAVRCPSLTHVEIPLLSKGRAPTPRWQAAQMLLRLSFQSQRDCLTARPHALPILAAPRDASPGAVRNSARPAPAFPQASPAYNRSPACECRRGGCGR